ncbi:D-serine ammonia-lyase DSD1 KNAG_0G01380 [Huiozyma naganishii CBS 8797]|uniref:D-serine dehydratase n=1 Tax=Huiozyma naganishii (strain ATCC MYA-139 / BCRC 22969 / CBS 8797 / KCTC 17520 / NBRC 10181 / NCYC 3082 / Yp74L-3) TaxID=1071383 RepID=J7S8Z3_HUIN7|nr:hypothetical protein KNAG_0G01380 [Kazachstania naganishii CBS 8797]CCK71196.1 hypothetical protein KNAG_0G01380 [Kazachstania naganishii CBS 8797]
MSDLLSIYKGVHFKELPTPSFVINERKFNENCIMMLENVEELRSATGKNVKFRAHIKTHKTAKGTFKQLGVGLVNNPTDSILISTVKEAQGLLDYEDKTGKDYVKDICFSLPACIPEYLESLVALSKMVDHLRIFVDCKEHLDNLVKFGRPQETKKWSVFLKIDMGTRRAGVVCHSKEFRQTLSRLSDPEVLEVVQLYGIYAHAGHSYSLTSIIDSHKLLMDEIQAVNEAAVEIKKQLESLDVSKLVLSVGATPTSNSLRIRDEPLLIDFVQNKLIGTLEIHCGNYCLYDLQQLSTGCIKDYEIAGFVLGSVVSHYEERNEILTNTGVMALTRETSKYKGHGVCVKANEVLDSKPYNIDWYVDRVSQEHGILKPCEGSTTEHFALGTKIAILPQHACIVMAQFPYYFVVDDNGMVTDVWLPFQKW